MNKYFVKKAKHIIFLLVFLFGFNTFATRARALTPPELNASIAILVETGTGKALYEKDADERAYPASMTKILTALVFVENMDLDEIIVTGSEVNDVPPGSSRAGHRQGESITGLNLLRALMLRSGNETGNVMAAAVARKISGGNIPFGEAEKLFVDLMNEKAKELGATHSNFKNAHGFHEDEHYTTARDMALICQAAMENPAVADVVSEISYEGSGTGGIMEEGMITQDYNWRTTNALLLRGANYYQPATGIKTGFTDMAGYCFAGSAEKDGVSLISVVFNDGEEDRWADTVKLFEYGFNNHRYEHIQSKGDIIDTVELYDPPLGAKNSMDIYTDKEFMGFFSIEDIENIKREIIYNEEKKAPGNEEPKEGEKPEPVRLLLPINKGENVGLVRYTVNDSLLFEAELIASEACVKRDYKTDFNYYYNLFVDNAFTLKALPGWIFIFSVIILIIFLIIEIVKRRRKKDFYTLKKRY